MKKRITANLVAGLEVQNKIYDITDDQLPGFVVRVNPSGLKVYCLRYTLSSGKRDRFAIGKVGILSVAQAREEAKKILGQVSLGLDPKANNHCEIPTLKQFIENEYKVWSESHHQWSDDQIQKLYRFKEFLDLPLLEVNSLRVEKWRSQCLKAGHAPATVNRNVAALRSVLTKALEWNVIDIHPLGKFKQLKIDRSPNIRYLSDDEEKRLRIALDEREARLRKERENGNLWRAERGYELYPTLNDVPFVDHLKPLVLLSINTGARRGELFRLQWDDIDFERKSLALVMRGKRKSYTRHIPLNREAFEALHHWLNMKSLGNKMVFPAKDGGKFDNVQTSWDNLRKEAKINNFRWHDMRHHFASRLVMNGIPLNTVRELLGHTNLEMTLRYAHLAPEQKINAVESLNV